MTLTNLNNQILKLLSNRDMKEEGSGIPSFPKPVAHNSNHAGPTGGLQQAIHDPQAAVQPLVVEMQPFRESAKDEHRREEERMRRVSRPHGHTNSRPSSTDTVNVCSLRDSEETLQMPLLRAALSKTNIKQPPTREAETANSVKCSEDHPSSLHLQL